MKRRNKIFLVGCTIAVLTSSCTRDIELEPISQISSASFWKTPDDAKGALYGMYSSFREVSQQDFGYPLFVLGEQRSDAIDANFAGTQRRYWENAIDANNPGPNWIMFYNVLHHANLMIKYVSQIDSSLFDPVTIKNNMLAQAHTMRAFIYYVMARTWGDVPMIIDPTESINPEESQKERSPKEEVFALIKKDLDIALQLYPSDNFENGRNIWSRAAANALKGDVYLWTGKRMNGGTADFNIALTALTEVYNADVELLPKYSDIFSVHNKGNKEILFAIMYKQFEAEDNWGLDSYMHPNFITTFSQETIDFIGIMGGRPFYTVSKLARDQFTLDDQRRLGTFYEVFKLDVPTGTESFYGSFATKYSGTIMNGKRLFTNDVVIYRFAEVLLLIAEAKNALGIDPSDEINEVRMRAYGDNYPNHIFVSNSKEQNDAAILKERLLELTLEGKRWWDLVRFGKAFDLVPSLQGRAAQEHLLLWPVSETIRGLNPKITQTPGY